MLVIIAIEAGVDFSDLVLADPVEAVKAVSRDLTLQVPLPLLSGGEMTALDIQEQYRSRVYAFLYGKREPHVPAMSPHHSCFSKERTEDLCTWWKKVLKDLRSDPMATSHYLDWTAKLALLTKLQERYQCGWDDARLTALDFSYSDLRPSGIYNKLVAAGRMRLMVDEAAVRTAVTHAPTTTRAWLRGALVEKFGSAIVAASWDSISVAGPNDGVYTLRIGDPLSLGEANCAPIVDNEDNPETILRRVSSELLEGER